MSAPVAHSGFTVAVCVSVLVVLETSKITTALPSIAREMHISVGGTQALTAGFLLATAIVLVPAGRLGDRFGRRALMLAALGVFLLGSLAAGIAMDERLLVAGRILQGIGTGLALPQTIGLIGMLPGSQRSKAHATYGIALALGNVLGPVVGGALVALVPIAGGWRALFFANVPAVLALGFLVVRQLPQGASSRRPGVDLVGIVLLGSGLAALVLPLAATTGSESDRSERWLLLALAAVALTVFVRWEWRLRRRGRDPLLDPAILTVPPFRRGVLIGFGWYASVPATLLLISLYAQGELGLAPMEAGLLVTPFAIGAGIGSFIARSRAPGASSGLILAGILVNTAGIAGAYLAAATASTSAAILLLIGAMLIAGIGGGIFSTGNQVRTLTRLPPGSDGVAGGIQQLAQRLANCTGLALTVTLFSFVGGTSLGLSSSAFAWGLTVPLFWLVVASVGAAVDLACGQSATTRKSITGETLE